MRHRVYGKHFGRNKDERDNLFRGLVQALFIHGTIETSETKAKAVKPLIDKIITLAKDKQAQSQLSAFLTDKDLRERLVKDIVPKLGARTSGYTQLVKIGTRLGDQTTMVRISLIGAEELKPIVARVPTESRTHDKIGVKSLESREKSKGPVKAEKKVSVQTKKPQEVRKVTRSRREEKKSSH